MSKAQRLLSAMVYSKTPLSSPLDPTDLGRLNGLECLPAVALLDRRNWTGGTWVASHIWDSSEPSRSTSGSLHDSGSDWFPTLSKDSVGASPITTHASSDSLSETTSPGLWTSWWNARSNCIHSFSVIWLSYHFEGRRHPQILNLMPSWKIVVPTINQLTHLQRTL